MYLRKVVNGQAIRFMDIVPSTGQTLYGINLVRAFESRYGFFESPKTIEEFRLTSGITFRHGIFDRRTVIDKAMIYNNGILAEGAITTQECLDFISDVVNWASDDVGIKIANASDRPVLYNSPLHVEAKLDINRHFQLMAPISRLITDKVIGYGAPMSPFEVAGLSIQSGVVQTVFRIEKLAGAAMDSNLYFSTAPLSTIDHMEVLTAIEAMLTV